MLSTRFYMRGDVQKGVFMNSMLSYKENTTHGDRFLPIQYYYCTTPHTYRELPLHWHEEMEITIIQHGVVSYDINFQSEVMSEGDLILISPHILHSASQVDMIEMASHSILFHFDLLGVQSPDICTLKYITPIANGTYKMPSRIQKDAAGYDDLYQTFLSLITIFEHKKMGFELLLKEQLYHFIYLLYQHGHIKKEKSSAPNTDTEEKIKMMLTYIKEHYSRQLTINELAKHCHFSEVHFMNFFKKYTGMTCISYINTYRLEIAASQLSHLQKSITSIAMDCGFPNISYFNRQFKSKYHSTPKEYRQQYFSY